MKHRNYEQILMYLDPDKADQLRKLAKRLGRPVAEIVREAVDDVLVKLRNTKPRRVA